MTFWKTTAIYGIGFIFLRAISFLLLPLYTNLLSQHDVGWIFIIYTILAFLNVLYTHGMNASLFKFFHGANNKEIITTSIFYSVGYALVLSMILFTIYIIYNIFFKRAFIVKKALPTMVLYILLFTVLLTYNILI